MLRSVGGDVKALMEILSKERIRLPKNIHPKLALDDVQCFTDYEPKSTSESSLVKQAVGGVASSSSKLIILASALFVTMTLFRFHRMEANHL